MANNKKKTTNAPKSDQIDNLPYFYSQKPRSSPPKRRSDFSSFSYSAPLSNSGREEGVKVDAASRSRLLCSNALMERGHHVFANSVEERDFFAYSLPGSSCGEVGLSNVTINSLHDRKAEGKQLPEHPLVQCCKFQDKELRFTSDFSETLIIEVETVAQNELFDSLSERNVGEQTSDTARSVECTPSKSPATESNGFCITPGSIVWAKTASHMWWPAKIMDQRYNSADTRNQDTGGHVLVEFYGSNDIAWLDPARDLSQLEDVSMKRHSIYHAYDPALLSSEHDSRTVQLMHTLE